jgi:hypothetical protein
MNATEANELPPERAAHGRGSGTRRATAARVVAAAALAGLFALACSANARAEVSANDGYAPDGTYQWHFELAPYAWVPATSAHIRLGNGATANINAGMPTVSELRNVLTGAFMGLGRLRYGPWSAEINIDYVAASQTEGLAGGPAGVIGRTVNVNASLWRVAPDFGYEVYKGAVGSVPTTVDALVGFAYFSSSTSLDLSRFGPQGERLDVSTASDSNSFVQPWVGFRAAIYPWPRWRFELSALVQGFGVNGGSWGWGAGVDATWAATKWLNLIAGFYALNSQYYGDSSGVVRSLNMTLYGPVMGLDFSL